MDDAYFGPTKSAIAAVSSHLRLPITGREQDWEIEFADPGRLVEMLPIFGRDDLDVELQSALALLVLHSINEAAPAEASTACAIERVREILAERPEVRRRMISYWSRFEAGGAVFAALAR